tara:strand:+ start:10956 stop:13811 length:2856 start_codon:yes stop_codon:yes gene_type:complete
MDNRINLAAYLNRYDDPEVSRQRLLQSQRVKVDPNAMIVKKLKKKKKGLKKTKNIRGEVAANVRLQRRFERGERRDRPEQEPRIVGDPAPGAGGPAYDVDVEREKIRVSALGQLQQSRVQNARIAEEKRQFDAQLRIQDRERGERQRQFNIERRIRGDERGEDLQIRFDERREDRVQRQDERYEERRAFLSDELRGRDAGTQRFTEEQDAADRRLQAQLDDSAEARRFAAERDQSVIDLFREQTAQNAAAVRASIEGTTEATRRATEERLQTAGLYDGERARDRDERREHHEANRAERQLNAEREEGRNVSLREQFEEDRERLQDDANQAVQRERRQREEQAAANSAVLNRLETAYTAGGEARRARTPELRLPAEPPVLNFTQRIYTGGGGRRGGVESRDFDFSAEDENLPSPVPEGGDASPRRRVSSSVRVNPGDVPSLRGGFSQFSTQEQQEIDEEFTALGRSGAGAGGIDMGDFTGDSDAGESDTGDSDQEQDDTPPQSPREELLGSPRFRAAVDELRQSIGGSDLPGGGEGFSIEEPERDEEEEEEEEAPSVGARALDLVQRGAGAVAAGVGSLLEPAPAPVGDQTGGVFSGPSGNLVYGSGIDIDVPVPVRAGGLQPILDDTEIFGSRVGRGDTLPDADTSLPLFDQPGANVDAETHEREPPPTLEQDDFDQSGGSRARAAARVRRGDNQPGSPGFVAGQLAGAVPVEVASPRPRQASPRPGLTSQGIPYASPAGGSSASRSPPAELEAARAKLSRARRSQKGASATGRSGVSARDITRLEADVSRLEELVRNTEALAQAQAVVERPLEAVPQRPEDLLPGGQEPLLVESAEGEFGLIKGMNEAERRVNATDWGDAVGGGPVSDLAQVRGRPTGGERGDTGLYLVSNFKQPIFGIAPGTSAMITKATREGRLTIERTDGSGVDGRHGDRQIQKAIEEGKLKYVKRG